LNTFAPLLVISCDRYSDLWRPFFTLFFRQWPNCPFPVFLGTNHLVYSDDRVKTITIGEDLSWATGVTSMIDRLESERVVIFLEDFLIQRPVDDAMVRRLYEIACKEERVACIRLSPLPPPSRLPDVAVPGYPELGIVEPGTPYRVSAQPAIWRTDVLRKFLIPGFTAWQFEEIGTQLSEKGSDQFWGPFRPAVVYDHGVEKGKWKPEGLRICREAGVSVDLNARGAFAEAELASFVDRGKHANEIYGLKSRAIRAFRSGRRGAGIRAALQYFRSGGNLLHTLAVAAFGVAGPRAIASLERWHLARKIRLVQSVSPGKRG